MPLEPGTRLGAYEITSSLGAGGMGEVYRARDTRLLRDVAVKVLPSSVAADADRLRRFEQEARATAALNHPNILAVYDVGREGDIAYVVEELLEGETLRDALASPLPARKVVDYATQIANGLAAAHEKGIVHRDLKPENVFITRDGRVKVLDFGLARTIAPAGAQSQTSTRLASATEPGVVLGTVGYMAPEQVRGLPVDHRADIFSLGAVIYEMLTGRRAFHGRTAADTISALLKEPPPDPSESGRPMPPALARIVWRCLEKDTSLRFQSATDLAFALQSLSVDSTSSATSALPVDVRRAWPRWLIVATAMCAGFALGGVIAWRLAGSQPAVPAERFRFNLSLADGLKIDDLTRASVSPDGRQIAFSEPGAGDRQLSVFTLADGSRRELGPMSAAAFGWSPDGRWLAYFGSDRALYKVSVESGQRQRLAQLEWAPISLSWSNSGDILVTATVASAAMLVSSEGGSARPILEVGRGAAPWLSIQALPDDRRLLLSRASGDTGEILLANADGSGTPRVIGSGFWAHFVAPDRVIAYRNNQIVGWRTRLDDDAVLSDQPSVIADGVQVRGFPFSAGGSEILVFRSAQNDLTTRLAWFDRTGREAAALALDGHCRNPELSPGYDRVAVECYQPSGTRDVWVYDLARDAATRLTNDPADDADPIWTNDGRSIVFASSRRGTVDIFKTAVGGGRSEELVVDTTGSTPVMALTPDGTQAVVLATSLAPGSGLDLAAYLLTRPGAPLAILNTPAAEIELQFAPNGRFMSYGSNQSGRFEVYVEPWPQTGERWPISTTGGADARWSADGREIFYLMPDRRLMSVPVRPEPPFVAGRPVELFQTRVAGPLGLGHRFPFAVDKDGKRFLMYVSDPQGPPPAVSVLTNWSTLLVR